MLRTRRLPAVLLTGSPSEEETVRGCGLGPVRCVRKPLGFPTFVDTLRDLGVCCRVLQDDHGLCGSP